MLMWFYRPFPTDKCLNVENIATLHWLPDPRGFTVAQGQWYSTLSSLILLLKVAEDLVTLAYENGINLFDTAEVYNVGK